MTVTVDSSSVLHPFHAHKMDSGPVRLMTIAHASGGGIKGWSEISSPCGTIPEGGKVLSGQRSNLLGSTSGCNVSNCFHFDGRGP